MAPRSTRGVRSRLDPNLATSPFVNARPVERLSWLLWVLAFAVGGAAYLSTSSARQEAGARRAEIERLSAETATLRERATRLRAELEAADLTARNERTQFLNQRIAERAFSWNDLIDALGEVLPRGVRLRELSPQGFEVDKTGRRARGASPATSQVRLSISGEAEEGEALLEFVDRLYRHPAFLQPNLARESTKKDLQLEFNLSVSYVPGWRKAAAAALTATVAGPDAPGVAPGAAAGRSGPLAATPVAAREETAGEAPSPEFTTGPVAGPPPGGSASPAAGAVRRYVPPATGAEGRGTTSAWGAAAASAEEAEAAESSAKVAGGRSSTRGTPIAPQGAPRGPGGSPVPPAVPVLPAPLGPFASAPPELR